MRISDWSSDVCSSDLRPGLLGDRLGPFAGLDRMLAGGCAVLHPAHDALQDACNAKHIIGHIEIDMRNTVAAGAPAVGGDILLLGRNTQRSIVDSGDAAEGLRGQPDRKSVV